MAISARNQVDFPSMLMAIDSKEKAILKWNEFEDAFALVKWLRVLLITAPMRTNYEPRFYTSGWNAYNMKGWLEASYSPDEIFRLGLDSNLEFNDAMKAEHRVAMLIWRSVTRVFSVNTRFPY